MAEQVVDLRFLTETRGFKIIGDRAYDSAGFSVSGAGDVNGDGLADVIVGAPGGDDGGEDSGQAYVIYGRADARGALDLTTFSAVDGFELVSDGRPRNINDRGSF